ncbi:MAG: hypothetical protein JNN07_11225 [Verrucomicrobiales bacterium]|nr:hypothetical protein [Verrucomicrobiales bacterium]
MQPTGFHRWLSSGRHLACCLLLILGSGCSSFNRHWKEAAQNPSSSPGLVGAWDGTWVSEASGHQGRLRCLIQQQSATHYQAWFRANYARIFNVGYKVSLQVRSTEDRQVFQGEANLGSLVGGVYTYEGYATATNLFSTYRCRIDHGRFELNRPPAGPAAASEPKGRP